jgi:hypothetical protein
MGNIGSHVDLTSGRAGQQARSPNDAEIEALPDTDLNGHREPVPCRNSGPTPKRRTIFSGASTAVG